MMRAMKEPEDLLEKLSDVDMTPYEKQPLREHTQWIRAHLSNQVPDAVLTEALRFEGMYRTGRKIFTVNPDGGEDFLEFASDSEEDLRLFEFDLAAETAAQAMALYTRDQDRKQWRWDRDHAEHGRWMYIERKAYVYDAVFDERLAWFEKYLCLIRDAVNPVWFEKKVQDCTGLLNRSYAIPHWLYDRKKQKFFEISHSREMDIYGREEPSPDSIIKYE